MVQFHHLILFEIIPNSALENSIIAGHCEISFYTLGFRDKILQKYKANSIQYLPFHYVTII